MPITAMHKDYPSVHVITFYLSEKVMA